MNHRTALAHVSIVAILATIDPIPKLTTAPIKRPIDVENANAVARTFVPYCSGNHRLNSAKLPPKKPRTNSIAMNGYNASAM